MLHELFEYLRRHRAYIGSDEARLHNMDGMANRCHQHFSLEFVVVEDLHDRADLQQLIFKRIALFGNEGRIRRNPIEDARARDVANLVEVCSIEKKLHDYPFPLVIVPLATGREAAGSSDSRCPKYRLRKR